MESSFRDRLIHPYRVKERVCRSFLLLLSGCAKSISKRLDGRKSRNTELFILVHKRLKEVGIDRSIEQIKNRWQSLKTTYYKAKTHNSRSGVDPSSFPYYQVMDNFMGDRPLSNVPTNGVDVGFEEEEARCSTAASQSLDANESSISGNCVNLSF
uniref:Myb/SANT-like DNA-binding domain-containing protein n=1 Tax=Oryzias latipes TaxID=8090 RepID=A0A3P9LH28_ORYLA